MSENGLWPKYQARIVSAPSPHSSPHALFGGWEGSLKYVFYLAEIFMALKESHIGDQFSKELQLMDNLKFMYSVSVLLNIRCPVLHNMVYECQVSQPKSNHVHTCAEASLCTMQAEIFVLMDCALKLI